MKLMKLNNKTYIIIYDNNDAKLCSSADEMITLVLKMGVHEDELTKCMEEMIRKDHNYAEFGLMDTCTFTEKRVF